MTNRKKLMLAAAIAGMAIAVFLVQLKLPLGVVDSTLYPAVVLLSLRMPSQRHVLITAFACTMLLVIGSFFSFLSPTNTPLWHDLTNGLTGIFVVWMVTLYGWFERRRAKLLRERAALLNQVPDAVMVRDLDDRILFWNPGAEKLYGWKAEEVLGRGGVELFFQDHAADLAEARRVMGQQGEFHGELRQVTRKGKIITVEARWVHLYDDQGHPQATLVVNTDVTVKKKLEAQRIQSQRIESIGMLASGIAHDFNNLLQAIIANLSLINHDAAALPPEQQSRVDDCLAACTRAASLTRRLSALSAGTLSVKESTDVHAVASETFSLLRQTTHRLIEKDVDLEPRDLFVWAAPSELHQVLLNLGTNAAAAIEERPGGPRPGDCISISAERCLVEAEHASLESGRYVRLIVRDTGKGMSPEVMRRAFDPLFTTRERGEQRGQGLGLAMVYNIVVNGHRGHVEIESVEGEGTTIHVFLPEASGPSEHPRAPDDSPDVRGGTETVLVVDDEELVRTTAAQILQSQGYSVVLAVDGQDALCKYVEHRPDLIIVDLIMPKLSGEAVCETIFARDERARIVVSSGDAGRPLNGSALERVRAVLAKPYAGTELLRVVRKVLDVTT